MQSMFYRYTYYLKHMFDKIMLLKLIFVFIDYHIWNLFGWGEFYDIKLYTVVAKK